MNLMFSLVNTLSGDRKQFLVFSLSKSRIIVVLRSNGAFILRLMTTVTNKRSLIKTSARFAFKVFAGLITLKAASALSVANKEFFTDINSGTFKTFGTKITWVIKRAFVPVVQGTMKLDFLGNSGGILA